MGRRARKCAIVALLDCFTVHTCLFNNPLIPLSDSFTVKAFWHTYSIPLHVNEETEYLLGRKTEDGSKLKGSLRIWDDYIF